MQQAVLVTSGGENIQGEIIISRSVSALREHIRKKEKMPVYARNDNINERFVVFDECTWKFLTENGTVDSLTISGWIWSTDRRIMFG
jgi:hypothetical protein